MASKGELSELTTKYGNIYKTIRNQASVRQAQEKIVSWCK